MSLIQSTLTTAHCCTVNIRVCPLQLRRSPQIFRPPIKVQRCFGSLLRAPHSSVCNCNPNSQSQTLLPRIGTVACLPYSGIISLESRSIYTNIEVSVSPSVSPPGKVGGVERYASATPAEIIDKQKPSLGRVSFIQYKVVTNFIEAHKQNRRHQLFSPLPHVANSSWRYRVFISVSGFQTCIVQSWCTWGKRGAYCSKLTVKSHRL